MKVTSSNTPLAQPRSYAPVGQDLPNIAQDQLSLTSKSNQSVQAEGVWSGIKHFFIEVGHAVKGWWQKLFPPKLTDEEKAIAAQYHLLATKENIQAFLNEVHAYETDGIMGPGSDKPDNVKVLQSALKDLGYTVDVNGSYDDKTSAAIIAFKKTRGLQQNYKGADGNWAVNEYATQPTLDAIQQALESH
jgi:hypothetical protein